MINKDIVDYIKNQLQKGRSKEEIKSALTSAGWQMADIEEAFRYAEQNIPIAPATNNPQYSGQNIQNTAVLSSPTDLLKEAWGFYRAKFKIFVGIILVPMVAIMIFAGILIAGVLGLKFLNLLNSPVIFIFAIPLVLAIIILQFWSQSSLIFAIKDSEENIGVKESYRRGRHKIGSIFWVGLLSGIIILGGFMFFVIPGIIFSTWFNLAVIIVIAEGLGGMNALLKSKFYVSGYWWEVFWRFLFIGLILMGVNLIFLIPAGILNFIAIVVKSSLLSIIASIFSFIGNIVGLLLAPLAVIYTFLVYKNLKAIKRDITPVFSSGEKTKFIIAGILGILLFFGFIAGLIILGSSGGVRSKAMDAQRQAHIQSLQVYLLLYADDHNDIYPPSLNQLVPEYTATMHTDPKTKLPYEYRQLKGGEDFELCAKLEKGEKKCINSYNN